MKVFKSPAGIDEADRFTALSALSKKARGFAWPVEHVIDDATGQIAGVVIEFVPGETLEDMLDRRGTAALSVLEKATLALAVAEAVAEVHALSGPTVVLGDVLKAGNVIIDGTKATFIDTDSVSLFGYRLLDGGGADSVNPLTTPGYVASEVLANPTALPSHAADRFALAVVLFELFFGRPPHEPMPCAAAVGLGPDEAVRKGIFPRYTRHPDFDPPSYDAVDVPPEIDELFRAAFLTLIDRPSAVRWHEALVRWVEAVTPPEPEPERQPESPKPSGWEAGDWLATALVVVTLSLGAFWYGPGEYARWFPPSAPAPPPPLPSKPVGPDLFREIFE